MDTEYFGSIADFDFISVVAIRVNTIDGGFHNSNAMNAAIHGCEVLSETFH